jgi:hypothetical protein
MKMRGTFAVAALLFVHDFCNGQIAGDYTGYLDFARALRLKADLRIDNDGKSFEGILVFSHFKAAVSPELQRSEAEIKGTYDKKRGAVSITFRKWRGQVPNVDYQLATRQAMFDGASGVLTGDGLGFARRGSTAAAALERMQAAFHARALRQRAITDGTAKRSGAYEQELQRVRGLQQEQEIIAEEKNDRGSNEKSPLERAGSRQQRCALLERWVSRSSTEKPLNPLDPRETRRTQMNLFGDEAFMPIFGRPFDRTTEAWRLDVYRQHILPCINAREASLGTLPESWGLLGGAFNYGRGVDPGQVKAAVQRRRKLLADLNLLLTSPTPTSLAGYQALNRGVQRLADFADLWPSEIVAARAVLAKREQELARQIVPVWIGEMERLPIKLRTAERIQADLSQWGAPLRSLGDGAQTQDESTLMKHLDACLDASMRPKLAELETLQPTQEGIQSWIRWKTDFKTTFVRYSRPSVKQALKLGEDTLSRLLSGYLPIWQQEVAQSAKAGKGLEAADNFLTALSTDGDLRSHPLTIRYLKVPPSYQQDLHAALERLVREHASASPEARNWFLPLVSAESVSGGDAIRSLNAVRVRLDNTNSNPEVGKALGEAGLQASIRESLSKLGLRVDPNSPAELSLHLSGQRENVTSTMGIQRQTSATWSVWARASVSLPATVLRAGGYRRTWTTLGFSTAALTTIGEQLSQAAIEEVVAQAIQFLPGHANAMAFPVFDTEDSRRADFLQELPRLSELYSAYRRSAAATDDGKRPSKDGILGLDPLKFGISPLNRATVLASWGGRFFDPQSAWEAQLGRLGWTDRGTRQTAPIHYRSAYPKTIHTVTGGRSGGDETVLFVIMDQAAIQERSCFITLPDKTVRTTCLAGHDARFLVSLHFDRDDQRQQSRRTVQALVDSVLQQVQQVPERPAK